MDNFLDKLSSYNLLNNLLPGVLFLVIIDMLDVVDIKENNIILMLFGGYFAGMVLSRIGSLIIEPWFRKWKIVKYSQYDDYLKSETKDNMIATLLSESNTFRTIVAMLLILFFIYAICLIPKVKEWLVTPCAILIILFLLLLLFVASYRKQSTYIRKRVESAVSKK